jgi:phosphatidylethanolamine/phosphatidyl-N-methylethanolamine N-methyltransferase
MPTLAPPHKSLFYHRLSSWYETFFSPFFMARIHATVPALNMPAGSRVLEVGVGTGLSLNAYPHNVQVTGVDLSAAMLEHAQQKIERDGLHHITLQQMDAMNLEFPDNSFDYVMAFHLVSVVPDCDRLMQQITRVCKPGGKLVIINHLRSERQWVARAMDTISPVTHLFGWRTTLSYEELIRPVPIQVLRRYKTSPRSLFTVLIAEKLKQEE